MNKDILNNLAYLYMAFGTLDMSPNVTRLSMEDEVKMHQASMMLDLGIKQYNLTGDEYWLLKDFEKACSDFISSGLQMKGMFTKYFVYNYSTLHNCFKKLDEIYQKLTKYM